MLGDNAIGKIIEIKLTDEEESYKIAETVTLENEMYFYTLSHTDGKIKCYNKSNVINLTRYLKNLKAGLYEKRPVLIYIIMRGGEDYGFGEIRGIRNDYQITIDKFEEAIKDQNDKLGPLIRKVARELKEIERLKSLNESTIKNYGECLQRYEVWKQHVSPFNEDRQKNEDE